MAKKRLFIVTVSVMSAIVLLQLVIIISLFSGHAITTPENAMIVAKDALLRKYGELETQTELIASINSDFPNHWYVTVHNADDYEAELYVLVKKTNGKATLHWK